MEKITLHTVEHAFYKAGEAIGISGVMTRVAEDLRAAAVCYKDNGEVAETLGKLATQLDAEAEKQRLSHVQLVEHAIGLRRQEMSLSARLRRTASGALKGWNGIC